MTKQSFTALEAKPFGTVTSRLTSPILHVLPTRSRNEEEKIALDFQYQLRFNEDSEYTLMFFDFASQELLFSACLAQSYKGGKLGSDPFMKAMLEGDKDLGTDLYSIVAKSIGIKRNQAKGSVLASLYGCGEKLFSKELLRSLETEEEKARVKPLTKVAFEKMKGVKDKSGHYYGGVASNFFNWSTINQSKSRPVLPLLGQFYPKSISPQFMTKISPTASINYGVQSSCATNGMLSVYQVAVTNQFKQFSLDKCDARLAASVHDMVAFIVKKDYVEEAFIAMVRAYIQTWGLVFERLNLSDIPLKIYRDFVVDVSSCLRKDAFSSIKTPGFEWSQNGYQIMLSENLQEVKYVK